MLCVAKNTSPSQVSIMRNPFNACERRITQRNIGGWKHNDRAKQNWTTKNRFALIYVCWLVCLLNKWNWWIMTKQRLLFLFVLTRFSPRSSFWCGWISSPTVCLLFFECLFRYIRKICVQHGRCLIQTNKNTSKTPPIEYCIFSETVTISRYRSHIWKGKNNIYQIVTRKSHR